MPGDLEPLLVAAPGAGPALLAGELLGRVRAELPVVGQLGLPSIKHGKFDRLGRHLPN